MGIARHTDTRWGMTCLLVLAACGSSSSDMEGSAQEQQPVTPFTGERTKTTSSSAGAGGPVAVMRAIAEIAPTMFPPPADMSMSMAAGAAGNAMGAAGAGMNAAAAGMDAAAAAGAGDSAAGAGAAGMSADGSAGASGADGMGAGYAAGSGGGDASAGTGAAGDTSMAAAGAGTTGAAGMAAMDAMAMTTTTTTPATTAGAAGEAAPAVLRGTATFVSGSSGVKLTVMVSGCTDGKSYPIHVHQGTSCESVMAQGPHWDMTRGEGIPNITCGNGQGATTHTRSGDDAMTAWTVGDGGATDVVGHVVVIHDADTSAWRIACGPIMKL